MKVLGVMRPVMAAEQLEADFDSSLRSWRLEVSAPATRRSGPNAAIERSTPTIVWPLAGAVHQTLVRVGLPRFDGHPR